MSKVPAPKHRKPPSSRGEISHKRVRLTREEMRQAVAHDHTYALSPPSSTSSFLSSVQTRDGPALAPSGAAHTSSVASFCIEAFMDDDSAIHFYILFPTYAHLMICYNFPGDAVHHIIYPGSSVDPSAKTRMKSQQAISPQHEFFLTLCRLMCGLMEQDLACRFQISQSTVSRIFTAWVNFLYYKFKEIPIWPIQTQVQSLIPEQFKLHYSSTHIIIDATEVFIQTPSDPHAQQLTFSSYKNHNTAKALAGITPSGAFSFITPLYGGSISDCKLFLNSGLLEILEEGDAVMADKGFNIADVLQRKGITLNIPPRKHADQLGDRELIETCRIASLRIHIERAFSRVKVLKILNNIPNNMAGLASEIFFVCAILTNFQPPLCMRNSQ
ncbi:PREDICTED: uncharacterized protein LOC100636353 [Amphimedon queenslandica]|uniref:DDE Tnp4 domain-containing protein n=2 Tax=Amphimedon queenslandica TaxID=400682 RepID=A0AAN0I8C2_AMPQE|nr:PREDICTED: uncharacterized protein LOC100636353 [Amphimedon queenslandica]|eukprot:XP_003382392.1 PREDICTED: uncharacterized protein LOC100636353 [Amphimedon queenslandica]